MIVQEPVQAAIWHCLNHYAYADAIFLAERLFAEVGTDEALFLMATCYYRCGNTMAAYSVLHNSGSKNPQCKFLLAKCCVDLAKLAEAEMILVGNNSVCSKNLDTVNQEYLESGCFALQLVGEICRKSERRAKACDAYSKSVKLNPFLWTSYKSLCDLGNEPDSTKTFQVSSVENFNMCQGSNPLISLVNSQQQQPHCNANLSNLIINENTNQQDGGLQSPGLVMTPLTSCGLNVMVNTPSPLPIYIKSTPKIVDSSDTSENTPLDTPDGSYNLHYTISSINKANESTKVNKAGRNILGVNPCNSPFTPSFGFLPLETPSPSGEVVNSSLAFIAATSPAFTENLAFRDGKPPPKRMMSRTAQNKLSIKPPVFSQSFNSASLNSSNVSIPPSSSPSPNVQQNVRRSTRLFSNSNSVKENNKGSSKSNRFTSPKAPPRRTKARTTKSSTISQPNFNDMNEINKPSETVSVENKVNNQIASYANIAQTALSMQKVSAEGLMSLLQEFGKAYLCLTKYECHKVLEILSQLPPHHYSSGWVQACLGRAYFELAQYEQAVNMYKAMRKSEPHCMDGLEYYSTALWHLQKEIALSTLAQELTDADKKSAQAWCATGNCFSLQKEHDTAIKFFERAVQVDPNFAYAYTLLGHEYVVIEELERAMSCYRNAIRIDPRHYNAWYGVGMIYYKLEKFQLAEIHFKRSLLINPQSSVLMCHVAVVQHALQKTEAALITLNKAILANPKNPLCKFHRASMYFASDRHQEALKELEELKEIVPKESLVYFLIGKVHKRLGNTHLALMNFSWATDLDPKGANNQMKEAIDKRYANDDDDLVLAASEVTDLRSPEANLDNEEELSRNSSVVMEAEWSQQNMDSDESY